MAGPPHLAAAPPHDGGMQVEATDEGLRITLRPKGAARWFVVGFLLVWLVGWTAGEGFALATLLSIGGQFLRIPLPWRQTVPTGPSAGIIISFLLMWVSFWTVAGIAAFSQVLHMGWGTDLFLVRPGGWEWHRRYGFWWRRRRFLPGEVLGLTVRRNDGALEARTARQALVLTTFGDHPARQWLCVVLRQTSGLDAREEDRTESGLPLLEPSPARALVAPEPPRGWVLDSAPDGTRRLTRSLGAQLSAAGCLLGITLFWNGIVSAFVAGGLGQLHARREGQGVMAPGQWGYWLFLTPFIAVGLVMISAFIWSLVGGEEWRLGADELTLHRRCFGWSREERLTGGELLLSVTSDSDGDDSWSLVAATPTGRRTLQSGAVPLLGSLGAVLSYYTGWTVREVRE